MSSASSALPTEKKAFLKIDEKNMIVRNGTSHNCVYQGKEEGNFKQIDYFK